VTFFTVSVNTVPSVVPGDLSFALQSAMTEREVLSALPMIIFNFAELSSSIFKALLADVYVQNIIVLGLEVHSDSDVSVVFADHSLDLIAPFDQAAIAIDKKALVIFSNLVASYELLSSFVRGEVEPAILCVGKTTAFTSISGEFLPLHIHKLPWFFQGPGRDLRSPYVSGFVVILELRDAPRKACHAL